MGLGSTVYCSGASAIAAFTLPCPCPGNATRPSGGPSLRGLGSGRGRDASSLLIASAANPRQCRCWAGLAALRVLACCTGWAEAEACRPFSRRAASDQASSACAVGRSLDEPRCNAVKARRISPEHDSRWLV